MPPFGENIPIAATDVGPGVDAGAAIHASFCFVPRELAIQCRQLIESYHTLYGYVGPADMLGLADTRDIIEGHRDLARIFKKASNDGFLLIATTILSVELLARDFSGWGKRFPAARCKAEKVLQFAAATANLVDGSVSISAARGSLLRVASDCSLTQHTVGSA